MYIMKSSAQQNAECPPRGVQGTPEREHYHQSEHWNEYMHRKSMPRLLRVHALFILITMQCSGNPAVADTHLPHTLLQHKTA